MKGLTLSAMAAVIGITVGCGAPPEAIAAEKIIHD